MSCSHILVHVHSIYTVTARSSNCVYLKNEVIIPQFSSFISGFYTEGLKRPRCFYFFCQKGVAFVSKMQLTPDKGLLLLRELSPRSIIESESTCTRSCMKQHEDNRKAALYTSDAGDNLLPLEYEGDAR